MATDNASASEDARAVDSTKSLVKEKKPVKEIRWRYRKTLAFPSLNKPVPASLFYGKEASKTTLSSSSLGLSSSSSCFRSPSCQPRKSERWSDEDPDSTFWRFNSSSFSCSGLKETGRFWRRVARALRGRTTLFLPEWTTRSSDSSSASCQDFRAQTSEESQPCVDPLHRSKHNSTSTLDAFQASKAPSSRSSSSSCLSSLLSLHPSPPHSAPCLSSNNQRCFAASSFSSSRLPSASLSSSSSSSSSSSFVSSSSLSLDEPQLLSSRDTYTRLSRDENFSGPTPPQHEDEEGKEEESGREEEKEDSAFSSHTDDAFPRVKVHVFQKQASALAFLENLSLFPCRRHSPEKESYDPSLHQSPPRRTRESTDDDDGRSFSRLFGLFAQEVSEGGVRRYLVVSYRDFVASYLKMRALDRRRHLYEVLREGRPCWLYFDLEYSKMHNPPPLLSAVNKKAREKKAAEEKETEEDQEEALMTLFKKMLIRFMRECFSFSLRDEDIIDLDSSTDEKFSRHLIVKAVDHALAEKYLAVHQPDTLWLLRDVWASTKVAEGKKRKRGEEPVGRQGGGGGKEEEEAAAAGALLDGKSLDGERTDGPDLPGGRRGRKRFSDPTRRSEDEAVKEEEKEKKEEANEGKRLKMGFEGEEQKTAKMTMESDRPVEREGTGREEEEGEEEQGGDSRVDEVDGERDEGEQLRQQDADRREEEKNTDSEKSEAKTIRRRSGTESDRKCKDYDDGASLGSNRRVRSPSCPHSTTPPWARENSAGLFSKAGDPASALFEGESGLSGKKMSAEENLSEQVLLESVMERRGAGQGKVFSTAFRNTTETGRFVDLFIFFLLRELRRAKMLRQEEETAKGFPHREDVEGKGDYGEVEEEQQEQAGMEEEREEKKAALNREEDDEETETGKHRRCKVFLHRSGVGLSSTQKEARSKEQAEEEDCKEGEETPKKKKKQELGKEEEHERRTEENQKEDDEEVLGGGRHLSSVPRGCEGGEGASARRTSAAGEEEREYRKQHQERGVPEKERRKKVEEKIDVRNGEEEELARDVENLFEKDLEDTGTGKQQEEEDENGGGDFASHGERRGEEEGGKDTIPEASSCRSASLTGTTRRKRKRSSCEPTASAPETLSFPSEREAPAAGEAEGKPPGEEDRKKIRLADCYEGLLSLFPFTLSDGVMSRTTLIDRGVYTRNRCFRLLHSSKFNKSAHLEVSSSCRYPLGTDPRLRLLRTLASLVPPAIPLFPHSSGECPYTTPERKVEHCLHRQFAAQKTTPPTDALEHLSAGRTQSRQVYNDLLLSDACIPMPREGNLIGAVLQEITEDRSTPSSSRDEPSIPTMNGSVKLLPSLLQGCRKPLAHGETAQILRAKAERRPAYLAELVRYAVKYWNERLQEYLQGKTAGSSSREPVPDSCPSSVCCSDDAAPLPSERRLELIKTPPERSTEWEDCGFPEEKIPEACQPGGGGNPDCCCLDRESLRETVGPLKASSLAVEEKRKDLSGMAAGGERQERFAGRRGWELGLEEIAKLLKAKREENLSAASLKGGASSAGVASLLFFKDSFTAVVTLQGNRFCERIGRPHKSNAVKLVINIKEGLFYQKCFDIECCQFRSRPVYFPAHLQNLAESVEDLLEAAEDVSTESTNGQQQGHVSGEETKPFLRLSRDSTASRALSRDADNEELADILNTPM